MIVNNFKTLNSEEEEEKKKKTLLEPNLNCAQNKDFFLVSGSWNNLLHLSIPSPPPHPFRALPPIYYDPIHCSNGCLLYRYWPSVELHLHHLRSMFLSNCNLDCQFRNAHVWVMIYLRLYSCREPLQDLS